jgi:short-subunit dehydrogenase
VANLIIFGGSRGLGDAFACGVPTPGDAVWLVSRSRPPSLELDDEVERYWIEADLARPGAAALVSETLGGKPLDVLIYNAGVWEKQGFTADYEFEESPDAELQNIVGVNLAGAMACIQKLLPNLRLGVDAKIVLVGSTSGLDNSRDREVAYTASKFGVRGLGHALRQNLREDGIAVTVINPGWIASEIPWDRGLEHTLEATGGKRIPMQDLVAIVKCVLSLSPATCVKEIHVPAMADPNV